MRPMDFRAKRRLITHGIMLACAGALSAAYAAEYLFDLEPCILCLYQRVPYVVAGLLAILASVMGPGRSVVAVVALCGGVFLAGSAIAFYHVGVEQHWWVAVTSCGGATDFKMSLEQMNQLLTVKPEKSCDQVDWTLFGISMATYNAAISLFLAAGSLVAARWLHQDANSPLLS